MGKGAQRSHLPVGEGVPGTECTEFRRGSGAPDTLTTEVGRDPWTTFTPAGLTGGSWGLTITRWGLIG